VPYTVGPKGQVVIAKELRDRLGVKSGWTALQRIVEDHVEVYFLPPPHRESLQGILAKQVKRTVGAGEEWQQAREAAWRETLGNSGAASARGSSS
jgi:bifunctional DNA-binding transcriptional regulator/antitoxin component of YhaV-PrlF toxin-antitoxin module